MIAQGIAHRSELERDGATLPSIQSFAAGMRDQLEVGDVAADAQPLNGDRSAAAISEGYVLGQFVTDLHGAEVEVLGSQRHMQCRIILCSGDPSRSRQADDQAQHRKYN